MLKDQLWPNFYWQDIKDRWALIFFFKDTATPQIYTLSLHDALPISPIGPPGGCSRWRRRWPGSTGTTSRTATARGLTTCSPGPACCLRDRTCGAGWPPWTRPQEIGGAHV